MTTIFDIAKMAATSKSTVSRVISGNGYVSDEKRTAILKAIKTLDYVPNQTAQHLKAQKTRTIGFIASDYFPVVGDFLNYFVHIAKQYNYRVNLYFSGGAQQELETLNLLMAHSLDAVFILTTQNAWDTLKAYARFGPLATWQRVDSKRIYSSYVDHYPLYLAIMTHLKRQGYQSIGHVLSNPQHSNTQARLRAISEFTQAEPQIDQAWQCFFERQQHTGELAAKEWLALDKRPDAVIFYSDYVAAEFMATLKAAGKSIPEDCAIFGFDNSEIGRLMALSTVDPQLKDQTENAFKYLYNQLNAEQLDYAPLAPELIIRKSS